MHSSSCLPENEEFSYSYLQRFTSDHSRQALITNVCLSLWRVALRRARRIPSASTPGTPGAARDDEPKRGVAGQAVVCLSTQDNLQAHIGGSGQTNGASLFVPLLDVDSRCAA